MKGRRTTKRSKHRAVLIVAPDPDYYGGDFDYDDDFDGEEFDELDEAIEECGIIPGDGGCQLAGTEHCDFECPFRDHPEWLTGDEDE